MRRWILIASFLSAACGSVLPDSADNGDSSAEDAFAPQTGDGGNASGLVPDAAMLDGTIAAEAGPSVDTGSDTASPDSSVAGSIQDAGAIDSAPADGSVLDGAVPVSDGSTADAWVVFDASTIDAATMAPCTASRDVFYLKSDGGRDTTLTNLDALWNVSSQPYIMVSTVGGTDDSLEIFLPINSVLAPGVYPVGPQAAVDMEFGLSGLGTSSQSGTLSVSDFQTVTTSTGTIVQSLLLSYDVQTANLGRVEGCVSYARSDLLDGGADAAVAPLGDAASFDGGELQQELGPCLAGGNVIYVDGENGYPGITGPKIITGAQSTWSAGFQSGLIMQVEASENYDPTWVVSAIPAWMDGGTIQPGTYQSSGYDQLPPSIAVEADGGACPNSNGTFTVVTLESPDGQNISKLLMGFDLTCQGTGSLRGCVSYGR